MLTELGRKKWKNSENFNKKKYIKYKKNQSELKNIKTEMKNTLEGINIRLKDAEQNRWVV